MSIHSEVSEGFNPYKPLLANTPTAAFLIGHTALTATDREQLV